MWTAGMYTSTGPCYKNLYLVCMKFIFLMAGLLVTTMLHAQRDSTRIEAKLFLPANMLKGLSPSQSLTLHYVAEAPGEKLVTGKISARRIRDNQYGFSLQYTMYFRLVFVAGEYSAQLFCMDNREGKIREDFDFNILLEKKRFDPADLQFVAPCVVREE